MVKRKVYGLDWGKVKASQDDRLKSLKPDDSTTTTTTTTKTAKSSRKPKPVVIETTVSDNVDNENDESVDLVPEDEESGRV